MRVLLVSAGIAVAFAVPARGALGSSQPADLEAKAAASESVGTAGSSPFTAVDAMLLVVGAAPLAVVAAARSVRFRREAS